MGSDLKALMSVPGKKTKRGDGSTEGNAKSLRVLCVAQSLARLEALQGAIAENGYSVSLAFTADHAVAACVGNEFAAVVLDAEMIRAAGSGVAEAIKMVRPRLPILLIDHREDPARYGFLPKGVNASVTDMTPTAVLSALTYLLTG